jgi:glycosyltransferase involved in cell wall biosynthesis
MVAGDPVNEDTYGGVEEHADRLIRCLGDMDDIDLRVLMFPNRGCPIARPNIYYLNRLTRRRLFYPLAGLLDVIRILKYIDGCRPDIVHFQGTSPLFCIAALLAQRKYTTVLTMHGILMRETRYWSEGNSILGMVSGFIEKYTAGKIGHLIVVAPQIREIVNEIRSKETYVVPNGVELDKIGRIAPARVDKENSIMFVGSLIERKGVHILMEALRTVRRSIPNIHLQIAGSGPQEGRLKAMATAYGLGDNVSWLGFLEGDAKFARIKAAKMLVVPSLWESLPIVVLEGMACGKAIVTTDVGGIPLLVHDGENGYLVKPGDVAGLAGRIIELLGDDALLTVMGADSLSKAQYYRWERIAADTYSIYCRMTKNINS